MIDGIPNRPLYFYQKDIIGVMGVTASLILQLEPVSHLGLDLKILG